MTTSQNDPHNEFDHGNVPTPPVTIRTDHSRSYPRWEIVDTIDGIIIDKYYNLEEAIKGLWHMIDHPEQHVPEHILTAYRARDYYNTLQRVALREETDLLRDICNEEVLEELASMIGNPPVNLEDKTWQNIWNDFCSEWYGPYNQE